MEKIFCGQVNGLVVTFLYEDGYRKLWQCTKLPWPLEWPIPENIIAHIKLCFKENQYE